MPTRKGFFDCAMVKIGLQAVLTSKGIAVFHNARRATKDESSDPTIASGMYCGAPIQSS